MAVVIIVYTRTLGIINLDETIIEQFTLRRRWALKSAAHKLAKSSEVSTMVLFDKFRYNNEKQRLNI